MKKALPIFKQRHNELLEEIGTIRGLINEEQLKNKVIANTVHNKLCELVVKVKTHLAEEDEGIYPDLLTHSDPRLKTIAWNFIGGEKPLKDAFNEYSKQLAHCQFEFSPKLIKDTQQMLDMICKRIERERDVLFPELEKIGIA